MKGSIREAALACKQASATMAELSSASKCALLYAMADALTAQEGKILDANTEDLQAAQAQGSSVAMLDRLALNQDRLQEICQALREVADLPDPVGQVSIRERAPNGLLIERVRVPLGVIAMIYEARPNVTADAAALCLKAGNAVMLRGGSEALRSNQAIAQCLRQVLHASGLPEDALLLLDDLSREAMLELVQLSDLVDLVIPRGGEGLIRFVTEHARVPVIKHYKGVCHLYVDASANLEQALAILVDGKTSRPAACNALETLLVHQDVASRFLPKASRALQQLGVELVGDARARAWCPEMAAATEEDFAAEFLALKLSVGVVDSQEQAIAHIRRYGSDHTEVIVTEDQQTAHNFVHALRSAVVLVNASSRFSDGGELGLGAEIGISTTRLHAYGPMGAQALTIERFVVRGEGQVRHQQDQRHPHG